MAHAVGPLLDAVIDDRPDNCLDVALESKAGAILVWRGDEDRIPGSAKRLGIAVVTSVEACLDRLVAADTTLDGSGLLDRIRTLFGLRMRSNSKLRR